MKIVFFNKVLFDGTKEECEIFKSNLLDTLAKLDDELKDTYPMKQTDTYKTNFEALKNLNSLLTNDAIRKKFFFGKGCRLIETIKNLFNVLLAIQFS